jgi:hypothetical protein
VNVQIDGLYINPNTFSTSNSNAGTRAFEFDFRSTDYPSYIDSQINKLKDYETIQVKYYDADKVLKAWLPNTAYDNEEPVPIFSWSVG